MNQNASHEFFYSVTIAGSPQTGMYQLLSWAKLGGFYAVDPQTVTKLVKMAQENDSHRMINAGR